MPEVRKSALSFEVLRQFARKPERQTEHCELCHAEVRSEHPHLAELGRRRIICACDACSILFSGQSPAKFKRVPTRVRLLSDFHMTDAEWDGLLIPINLAFFFENSASSRVSAMYPSPAGATESLLPLESWNNILQSNPIVRQMEPDVEALLVNRVGAARNASASEHYIVPIDACYRLVGLIRLHWHGLSGGTEVWKQIGNFFSELRSTADVVKEPLHA
ncbi:MAG: DUF5947 family protein [Terriglobales bacterium]